MRGLNRVVVCCILEGRLVRAGLYGDMYGS